LNDTADDAALLEVQAAIVQLHTNSHFPFLTMQNSGKHKPLWLTLERPNFYKATIMAGVRPPDQSCYQYHQYHNGRSGYTVSCVLIVSGKDDFPSVYPSMACWIQVNSLP
jgi:hypothetical protein